MRLVDVASEGQISLQPMTSRWRRIQDVRRFRMIHDPPVSESTVNVGQAALASEERPQMRVNHGPKRFQRRGDALAERQLARAARIYFAMVTHCYVSIAILPRMHQVRLTTFSILAPGEVPYALCNCRLKLSTMIVGISNGPLHSVATTFFAWNTLDIRLEENGREGKAH